MKKLVARYQFHLTALGLLLITAAAYHGVLRCGFISYDDDKFVSDNPLLKAGLHIDGIKWAFGTFYQANWHPLTWMSYMVDKGLYDLHPMGFHLTNLLFHLANVLVLLVILKRMTGSLWKSAFVAGLFAVHPLHVESVAWIAERKDVLSTFFWFSTMWAYAWYAEKPAISRYALVTALFALGLMSKSMLVTLPLVLLMLDYWPLGRLRFSGTKKQAANYQALAWEKSPLLALSACVSVLTCMAQKQAKALSGLDRVPLFDRLSNAMVSYVRYLLKAVWPAKLTAFYPLTKPPAAETLGAILFLVLASYLVYRARRPYLTVGWLWYLCTLVPVIGIVQVGAQTMADRYTYIPLIGIFIVAAWGVPEVLRLGEKARIALAATACMIIVILAIGTWAQVGYWRNDVTLFGRMVEVTKNNYVGYSGLGTALARQGKYETAAEDLEKAIALRSDMPLYYLSLGNAYSYLRQYDKAIKAYSGGLALDPNLEDARANMEIVLARQRATREAGVVPPSKAATTHYEKAGALFDQGNIEGAVAQYRQAIEIDPKFAEAYSNLGLALKDQDRTDEAIAAYHEAIRLKPGLAEAHNNLAIALYFKGQYSQAWKEVYLCRKYGGSPVQDFLNALSQKMPDPGA